jgi:hypothetical protein
MSLLRGLKLEPLDEAFAAAALPKFQQRPGQLLGGFKVPDPKKLFFEGPEKAFDMELFSGRAEESWRGFHP